MNEDNECKEALASSGSANNSLLSSKCTVEDGLFVRPCKALMDMSEFGGPTGKRKGIFAWQYFKIEADKSTPARTFFGAKGGEHPEGMAFNYCPYCGEQINAPFAR